MKNKGFSFVELLVAVAILGIISLPIASSFALSAKIDAKARATYSASNAADDVLLLVTEIGSFDDYGKEVGKQDALSYIKAYYTKGYFVGDAETVVASVPDGNITCEFEYSNHDVQLVLTKQNACYRVDVTVTYTVAGETMQITRKGVLPRA